MRILKLAIPLYLLFSCSKDKPSVEQNAIGVNQVVLIDAEDADRCQIAKLISDISKYKAKTIGVYFMFYCCGEPKCDKNLQKAIRDSKSVVLSEALVGDSLSRSSGEFAYHAIASGPAQFIQDDGGRVTSYTRVIPYHGRWLFTFPMQLALQYDSASQSRLALISSPREYSFNHFQESDSIPIVPYREISKYEELVNGRIVIIGFVGTGHEDEYLLKSASGSVRRKQILEIIGEAVLDILRDLDDSNI